MAHLCVYALGDGRVLDVQSDLLDVLATRVVVPLIAQADGPIPVPRLNPVFEIAGQPFVMMTQALAAVPETALGTQVCRLDDARDRVTAALDMLFQGF